MQVTLDFDWQRLGASSAVPRSLDEKMGEIVSIADWGVPGGLTVYTPGVTEKIQAALDEAPLGCTLLFPRGAYFTADTLRQTRQINILFETGAGIIAIFDDDTKNVWEVEVEEAAHAGAGDVRQLRLDNMNLAVAESGGGETYSAKHTLHIENAAPMIGNLQMLVTNSTFSAKADQVGSAVHIEGLTTQAHTFLHCAIMNQVHLDANADGCSFIYSLILGTKTAFLVDVGAGAFKTEISHNLIVARDGAMRIIGGSQVDFIRNQVEQSGGTNANAHSAHIIVDAVSYSLRGINIERNNFGGGADVDHSIWLDATGTIFTGSISGTVLTVTSVSQGKILAGMVLNASGITAGTTITSIPGTGTGGTGTYNVTASQTLGSRTITGLATLDGTLISRNSFATTATGTDIKIASPAVKYTLIESDQELRGERGSGNFTIYPAYSTNTDNVGDLLIIDDSGTGTAHVKKTAVALGGASATMLLNSWTCVATMRFWRDRHVVRFEGYAVAPGSTQTDVVIGTLPEGFRPNQQLAFVIPAYVAGTGAAAFGVVNTNGTVQLTCAAGATVYLSAIRFEGKREGYDPGY